MEKKYNFLKMSIDEFEPFISSIQVGRTIVCLQQHHTYSPSYIHYKGTNHFELQRSMRNHHTINNGWTDIGQHFTTFPDGSVMTGRNLEQSPACIYGNNSKSICIEHVGNFDIGGDVMTNAQSETVLRMTAAICKKFSIPISTSNIVYHHWFNLASGVRNNGTKNNKSCPGTNFFGGNKVADCERVFLPMVLALPQLQLSNSNVTELLQYVMVSAENLNIRNGAGATFTKVQERDPVQIGAILRVYEKKNSWLKISASSEHWVNGNYCVAIERKLVTTPILNIRTGPATYFPKAGTLKKGEAVFISEIKEGWSKMAMEEKWIKSSYLN